MKVASLNPTLKRSVVYFKQLIFFDVQVMKELAILILF